MKTFESFRLADVRYLAFPNEGGFMILDDSGNSFGTWQTVEAFRKSDKQPIGRVQLSFRVLA